ncbi:MAG: DUF433 domain-containing protein [Erythrobacter sp.]|jgi:DNA-binding transcriptional MerR regulator|nr:DUF433 domain-containing protein [Erythrobacter sp.]
METTSIIGAFSAQQAERLSGVTLGQLRSWHAHGFLPASYADPQSSAAFSRIYSFKDIVTLRILNQLRNVHNVSLQELRRVAEALAEHGDDRWTKLKLYVHNRRVVVKEPRTDRKREITTNQYVVPIPVEIEVTSAREAVADLNSARHVGQVAKTRFINRSAKVIAGTRIPIAVIGQFADAGYSEAEIAAEYPTLTAQDIRAALEARAA